MTIRIRRLPGVLWDTGNSRSTHYLRITQGLFTKPIRLGPRAVGWLEHEIQAINSARAAGKSDEEIRKLVTKLEAARKGSEHDETP